MMALKNRTDVRTVQLKKEDTDWLDGLIVPLVMAAINDISATTPLDKQMKVLARNCYLQGILDGAQLSKTLIKETS